MALIQPAAANEIARRTKFGATRTSYVRRIEQQVRRASSAQGLRDPDFALSRDPDFWEKIEGNATIRGARDFRRHLVAGPRVVLEAPTPIDKPLIPYAEALVSYVKRFSTTRLGLADAPFRGLVVGRMYGHFESGIDLIGDGTKARWYFVDRIKIQEKGRWELKRFVEDGKTFWLWSIWDYDIDQWVAPPNTNWYLFHKYSEREDHFYGRDMGRVLYWLAHAEHVLWEAGLDTAERFGSPWILAKLKPELGGSMPGTGDEIKSFASLANSVKDILQKLRGHNILVGDERLMDISLLEAGLRGHDLIDRLIEKIQFQVRILILGSNLPTAATTGGSFALAEIQDESTRRLVRYDRELLGETLTEQMLARLLRWNWPALSKIPHPDVPGLTLADLRPPYMRIVDDEVDDPLVKQFRLQFAQSVPLPLRNKDLYDLGGFIPPTEEDETTTVAPVGGLPFQENGATHSPTWLQYAHGNLQEDPPSRLWLPRKAS